MSRHVIKPLAAADRKLIRQHTEDLIERSPTVLAAAERLDVSPSHLYKLRDHGGNPGDAILRKLKLRRVHYIEER